MHPTNSKKPTSSSSFKSILFFIITFATISAPYYFTGWPRSNRAPIKDLPNWITSLTFEQVSFGVVGLGLLLIILVGLGIWLSERKLDDQYRQRKYAQIKKTMKWNLTVTISVENTSLSHPPFCRRRKYKKRPRLSVESNRRSADNRTTFQLA